jgi:hypothetical protein
MNLDQYSDNDNFTKTKQFLDTNLKGQHST